MKKLVSSLMCGILAMSLLAGCGGSAATSSASATTDSRSSASSGATGGETVNTVATSGQKSTKGENINLSVILINGYEFFQDAIDQYCKDNPNVVVDVQTMDTDSYKTLIKTKFASNDAPDIIPVFPEADYFKFYENGYLADLSDMTNVLDRLNNGAIDSFTTEDNGFLGIPFMQQFLLSYYNKDMFEKYGLKAPTTWEELISNCKTLKDNGITPIALGHKDTWVTQILPYSLNATAVQDADPNFYKGTADGTSKFADNAGWLDTLNKYMDLINNGYVNEGSLSLSSEQMYEMFVNKEAAMTFTGTWGDANIYDLKPDFSVGGFPIPAEGGSTGVSVSISGGLGISGNSKYPEEAKKLLTYMLSKESLEKFGGTVLTCFKDVDTDISDAEKECLDMMKGKKGYQYDNTYFASGVQDIMFSSLQEMIGGTKTPEQVLQDMDEATAKANK